MIAVGGAGSSGRPHSPAARAPSRMPRITSTMKPGHHAGMREDHRQRPLLVLEDGNDNAHERLAGNESRGGEHPRIFDSGLLRVVEVADGRACVSVIQRIMPPTKIAKVVSSGRYMPTAKSIGLFTSIMISAMPIRTPTTISGHAISPPTMPLRQHGHQSGLRRRQLAVAEADAAAVDVGLVEQDAAPGTARSWRRPRP